MVYALVEPDGKVGRAYPLIFQPKVELEDPFERRYFEGSLTPVVPMEFVREAGTVAADFHHLRHMSGYVVSPKLRDTLRSAECSGWGTFPAVVRNRKGVVLEGYSGLVVTGRARALDRSGVREEQRMHPLGFQQRGWLGYQIVEESWDGTDVFVLRGADGANLSNNILLSARAASALSGARLRGFSIEPIETVFWTMQY